jgi:pyruvate/2-oxoglutarate dehydrogenase complex dihydrolipoamide acyltransferase (E2) component
MIFEIKVPEAGFNITEAVVSKWLKSLGEAVKTGENVVAVETDKINVEVPAEGDGFLNNIFYQEGETAPVGAVLGIIAGEGEAAVAEDALATPKTAGLTPDAMTDSAIQAQPSEKSPAVVPPAPTPGKKRRISPTAKALARTHGIDLSEIAAGSGPKGRVIKADVLDFLERKSQVEAETTQPGEEAQIDHEPKAQEKVKFVGWRKVIADRMTKSVRSVPHYNNAVEVDVTDLSQMIAANRKKEDQPRLTYLPFIMKAIKVGIDLIPEVNAFCYEDGFVVQDDLNIGVAVDLGEKLLVPVIKNVKNKSILQLGEEIGQIISKARADQLEPKDITGGTITITNAGVYGIMYGTPIILQPQTTIMSLGAVREVPSASNGSIELRKKMIIVCSFDHRVVHGGPGARFLREVQAHLEDLNKLMLSMR